MSEPIRTSAEKREKLATALKRNMARRKVASRQSPVASEAGAKTPVGHHIPFDLSAAALAKGDGGLRAPIGGRDQMAEPHSFSPVPLGEVETRLSVSGEGIATTTYSPHPKSHRAIPTSPKGRGKGTASA